MTEKPRLGELIDKLLDTKTNEKNHILNSNELKIPPQDLGKSFSIEDLRKAFRNPKFDELNEKVSKDIENKMKKDDE